jgi:hypothetical protein
MKSADDQNKGATDESKVEQISDLTTDDVTVLGNSKYKQTFGLIVDQNPELPVKASTEEPRTPESEHLTESEPQKLPPLDLAAETTQPPKTESVTESEALRLSGQELDVETPPPVIDDVHESKEHQLLLRGSQMEVQVLQQQLSELYFRQRATLAPGVPLLVVALVASALLPYVSGSGVFFKLAIWHLFPGPYSPSLSLCLLVLIAVLPSYYFWTAAPISNTKKTLHQKLEELERLELSTESGRRAFLSEKLRYLTKKAAQVFFESPDRRTQAKNWRLEANDAFSNGQLVEAQSLINSIDELVLREIREQVDQKTWQWMAVGIMFIYIGLLAVFAVYTNAAQENDSKIFGIPLGIIVWGATGSLAAILYKFYTAEDRVRLAQEVRWLIARPIIGIIMAGLSYLTLVSGFVLLGAAPAGSESIAAGPVGRIEIYWIFAFLAGFSDKFYLGIIDLLVAKTLPTSVDRADSRTADLTQAAVETTTATTANEKA